MIPLYHRAKRSSTLGVMRDRAASARFGPYAWKRRVPWVAPNTWCLKEEEADLWECAVLESAVAAAAAAEMETFEQEMEDDQPLDLSMKPRSLESSPTPRPPRPDGKPRGQDIPLCLIKDCDCNNHGPKSRFVGGSSIYDCGKYGPPVGDIVNDCQVLRFPDSLESRSLERESFDPQRACFNQADVPRPDMCRPNDGRTWDSRRIANEEERMETNLEHRFEELNPAAQSRYKLAYRTCINESEPHSANFKPAPKFYDSCDQNPQCFADLNSSGAKRDNIWRTPVNNEERYRHVGRPWGEDSNASSHWGWSSRMWNRSESYPSQSHWRPFADTPNLNPSAGRGQPPSQETLKSINGESKFSQSKSVASASKAVPPHIASKVQSPHTFLLGSKPEAPTIGGASGLPPNRNVCHSFASTVPLITNTSSVPTRRESQSLPSTPRNSGSPLVVPRAPYIRVTRSPKTFHNDIVQNGGDPNARACPFKRPQDCSSRRFMPGKLGSNGKENIDTTDTGPQGSGVPSEGVKMPALDYLISKVLVERIDIPFKPCNTEIKKIYNGESKGRLRLVDLIELQVEESLKA